MNKYYVIKNTKGKYLCSVDYVYNELIWTKDYYDIVKFNTKELAFKHLTQIAGNYNIPIPPVEIVKIYDFD